VHNAEFGPTDCVASNKLSFVTYVLPKSSFCGLAVSMLPSGTFGGLVVSMLAYGTFGGLVVSMLAFGSFGGLVVKHADLWYLRWSSG
jgi:hypothetical protein